MAYRAGGVAGYGAETDRELCLFVQVETAEALEQLEAIASVAGVDGVFIGPADLVASLGHVGEPDHPAVVAAVEDAIRRLRARGKPVGILTLNAAFTRRCVELGTAFTAVGVDLAWLARGADRLAEHFLDEDVRRAIGRWRRGADGAARMEPMAGFCGRMRRRTLKEGRPCRASCSVRLS